MTELSGYALRTAERLLPVAGVLDHVPTGAAATLAHGLAGTALLHARLSRVDPLFAAAAMQHWAYAARVADREAMSPGVFHQPGGLAASLVIGSGYLTDPAVNYAATRRAVRWLSARAVDLAQHHGQLLDAGASTPWHVYDTISGLAGIGRVLLAAAASGHTAAEAGLVASLRSLSRMASTRHGARPGWWVSAADHPPGVHVHPSGAATTGVAHGAAGPLAFLATASMAGYEATGQRTAIRSIATWLTGCRFRGPTAWPPYVSGDDLDRGIATPVTGRTDAWCYGTPGISAALHLAANALSDNALIDVANQATADLGQRRPDQWDVQGPTLCHGHAGIAASARHTDSRLADRAAAAAAACWDGTSRFGLDHHEATTLVSNPGFLTGAAGVALLLADHSGLPANDTDHRWDCLLLLS